MIMDAVLFFDGSFSAGLLTGTSVNSGTTFVANTETDSANILDMSQVASSSLGFGRDIGMGDDPALEIFSAVQTAFAGAGAAMSVQLLAAADNGSGLPAQATSSTTVTSGNTTATLTITSAAALAGFAVGQGIQLEVGTVRQEYAIITAITPATPSISIQFLGSGGAMFTHTASYAIQGYTLLQQSELYPVAYLAAGVEIFRVKIPAAPMVLNPKFYKLSYFVTGANMTAGQIYSGIIMDRFGPGPQLGYQSGIPATTYKYM
jgi:hypothetical protein